MVAIVKQNIGGQVKAVVRRTHVAQTIQGNHPDLKVGDRVEVVRKVNNPFLVRVK